MNMIILCSDATHSFSIIGNESGAFWTMMGFFAIIFSFGGIFWQIRIQNNANMMNFMESSENKWRSEAYTKLRKEICSKSTTSIEVEEEIILSFFEDLGILYKKGIVDLDLIWDKFSYYIEYYWEIFEPGITELREQEGDTSWFENYERLHTVILDYSQKKNKKEEYVITPDKVQSFRESEKKMKYILSSDTQKPDGSGDSNNPTKPPIP